MRRLFEDLEAEFEAGLRWERDEQVAAALRAQAGEVPLWEQLARRVGSPVVVRAGREVIRGALRSSYGDFYGVEGDDGRHHLVRVGPGSSIALPSAERVLGPAPVGTARRYGLMLALRELGRRREPVRVLLADGGTVSGTVEAVGPDYLEVAEHDAGEPRRAAAIRARRFIAFAALVVVSVSASSPPRDG